MDFEIRKYLSSFCVCFFASLFSVNVFASDFLNSKNNIELSAGGGIGKLRVGNTNFSPTATETDTLAQTKNPVFGDADFAVAYVIPLNQTYSYHHIRWFPALKPSLHLRYLSQNVQGQIYQYQDPDLDNYTYNLGVESTRVMLDATLTLLSIQGFSTFVAGGLGEGWTQITYSDSANTGVDGGDLSLNGRTNSGFVSEIGAGITYDIEKNFGVSLEYLYANYGTMKTSSTGTLDGAPASIVPAQFPLRSQEALIELYLKV